MRLIIAINILVAIAILTFLFFSENRVDKRIKKLQAENKILVIDARRSELLQTWRASYRFTMAFVNQMPDEYFGFKYAPEVMTYAEQWRHCCIYTCGQLAGRFELDSNPYAEINKRPPVDMNKQEVLEELNRMYSYVEDLIHDLPVDALLQNYDFAGDTIPGWRLFYAMENHIIHHRGQCIIYLRSKGIKPAGYFGW